MAKRRRLSAAFKRQVVVELVAGLLAAASTKAGRPADCRHPKHPQKTVTPAILLPGRARDQCSLSMLTSV